MLNTSSKKIEKEFKDLRKNLLDLTLKNQLLNFKPRAKTLTVVNQSATNVYQSLILQEKKMYFTTNKKDDKDSSKFSIWDHSPIDLSRFKDGDKTLQTNLTPKELQKRLFYINQQAKTMIDEQGYNILYIAIGFLEWVDNAKPKQKNLAPLILIPVTMERKKVGKSFELYWTEEELQTNISLKAKLKEDGIKLPEFTSKKYVEVVEHYIRDVKQAVSPMKHWKVNSNVALGFFSFTKFVMYNDLNPESWDDNVDLTKNELIEAIFNPNKNTKKGFNEKDIDKKLEYKDMYQVLDADSSQIAAIEDVKSGRNLVVEGPPGTGKSQTIVNLIAELLAEGKSVLFVSEKMAALDVVKDRLNKVGLGKFILEIHSHKTRRKKFLKELEKAANVRSESPIKIDQTLRKLEKLKNDLDNYAEIIHKPSYEVDLSAFELYGMKESADDYFSKKNSIIPLVRFNNPENITLKDLDDTIVDLENLAELYQTISNDNPWSKCSPKSLLPGDLREIELLINDSLFALDNFLLEQEKLYEVYGIKKPDSINAFDNSLNAFELLEDDIFELIDGSLLKSNIAGNPNDTDILLKKLEEYQDSSKILDKFYDNILNVDIDQLISELKKISNKKFSIFKNKQGAELVEIYYKSSVPSNESIINDLESVKKLIHLKQELKNNHNLAISYFGNYWHLNASIDDLKNISNWMRKFNQLLSDGTFSQITINLLSKNLFNINPKSDLADYINSGNEFKNQLSKLESKLNPRSKLIFKKESSDVTIDEWRNQLNNWKGQLSSLHLWSQYLNTKNSLKNTLSSDFIETIEKRNIKVDDVRYLVLGNFADSLLNLIFVENQELAKFIGELHENRIKDFKELDKRIIELNRKRIFQKLNKNIPKIYGGTDNPEAKILAGEFTRKSGHLPVRALLEKAGGMIKQIKPCFMMSPLSIAQYLDPTNDNLQFDVVIFDEASQVKPEDALGAFMRGKTAVVMGDTQQLPPTSFFDQIAAGESGEEVASSLDMESILHLCKLSFPVKMLKWHYRSRHESLIAVSNKEFYDDELLVYPSPSSNDPELGLKFNYNPDTVYDRGSGSVNKQEARDVVKEIFNHFDKYGDTKSLGVGTFSVAQKNAVLEELELVRKNRPELEPLFSDKLDEKFFVKNLETIQGDERDVILISIGYGFDSNRKMSLNFGPLNQDGGERRLNVLVTRAREKCVVFSNFKSHDIKLTANPPFGVKSLKEFLQYAENITIGTHINEEIADEPFEDAIANFLREKNYTVHKQIGCAGFRVDLAIVDHENPGKYILGIITDGKMYSSSKVARDRDRLREQVLNGLGWKLNRLWSTDWYRNRDLTQSKLLKAIEDAKKQANQEELKKSEEAKQLAEKLKIDAQKRAKELELAKKKELEEKSNDLDSDNSDTTVIDPDSSILEENTNVDTTVIDSDSSILEEDNKVDTTVIDPDSTIKAENLNSKKSDLEKVIDVSTLNKDVLYDSKIETTDVSKIKDNDEIIEIDTFGINNNSEDSYDEYVEIDTAIDENPIISSLIKKEEENKEIQRPKPINNSRKSESSSKSFVSSLINGLTQTSESQNKKNIPRENIEEEENKSLFSKVKFKPKLSNDNGDDLHSIASSSNYDDEYDLHSIASSSTFKNNENNEISLKDSLDNDNKEKENNSTDIETISVNEDYQNLEDNFVPDDGLSENDDIEHDTSILSEINNDISNNFQEDESYEGVSGIDNPLKKNSLYYNEDEKSPFESLSNFKKDFKYIKKSLNEIENPTPSEMVQTIDRTQNAKLILENNTINPVNKDLKANSLEDIIGQVSKSYENLEKDRFRAQNKLKTFDDKKLPKKGSSLKNHIVDYQIAHDIDLKDKDIYSMDLSSSITDIVKIEGPIHIDELTKRLKESSGTKRISAKFKKAVNDGVEKAESSENIVLIDNFIYDSNNHEIFVRKRNKPNIDLISSEEIEKNIETVLKFKQELDSKSLAKEVAHNFGFKSTSKKAASKINQIVDSMLAENKVLVSGDKISLK